MDVVEHLFANTDGAVTRVVIVVQELKSANTTNIKPRVASVLHIYSVFTIVKNIIAGNVFQINFVFITIELANVKNVLKELMFKILL